MDETRYDFVLDCSVTMAWCFIDEATPYTSGVRDQLVRSRAFVPGLWPLEVANATLMGERRGRLDEARSSRLLALLVGLPITVDAETAALAWRDTIYLARSHQLSAYDAAYLELAMRLGLPLATLDGKLKAAAIAVGVPIFEIP